MNNSSVIYGMELKIDRKHRTSDDSFRKRTNFPFCVNKLVSCFCAPLSRIGERTRCQYLQVPIDLATNECLLVQDLLMYRARLIDTSLDVCIS